MKQLHLLTTLLDGLRSFCIANINILKYFAQKVLGFFPKLHLSFAVSLNARKIRPKKIKEFQYFFKFAIDPIFEFCYTFQTYLCKMGGSLSVRLNFFQAES